MKETLERWIEFSPAFDKRDPDPAKNYGIHGVEMRWYVRGRAGAVQFVVYTNWYLPRVANELRERGRAFNEPIPSDLGYHSYKPHYEGQHGVEDCTILHGATCYYDGSSLNAAPVFALLVEKGSAAVWEYLENYYYETFPE